MQDSPVMQYWPNPAHKKETTEAGPPQWWPAKDVCPSDMSVDERDMLLSASIPLDEGNPRSRRWTLRRLDGALEFFDIKWTRHIDGDEEFHGHPASFVPARILRVFRDQESISGAEYKRLVKDFAVPNRQSS